MKKIIRYRLISDFGRISLDGSMGPLDLENQISEHLTAGYSLYGNPFSSGNTIYQAMVRYKE